MASSIASISKAPRTSSRVVSSSRTSRHMCRSRSVLVRPRPALPASTGSAEVRTLDRAMRPPSVRSRIVACRRIVSRVVRWTLVLSAAAACWPAPAAAEKTDIVVLQNGDRFTGEVKGMAHGKLDYSTDDAGRISIEWDKVASLTSPHFFQVEVGSGIRYFGQLAPA